MAAPEFVGKYSIGPDHGPHCAICGGKPGTKKLARDHCHSSGIRRGNLCHLCNTGLGMFRDDPNLMREAIKYLIHYGKISQ